MNHEVNYQHL